MISHAPGQGGQALGVIKNNNGKRVKKLKYRDLIAADLSEKDLKKFCATRSSATRSTSLIRAAI